MLERKLRIYFGYLPSSWLLALLIGLLLLLLSWRITPDGNLASGLRSKAHKIFADTLGMDKLRLEGWMNLSLSLCGWMLPGGLVVVGGAGLWRYWQDRPTTDGEADTLIGQALASLPSRAAVFLGLPNGLPSYQVIILWSPRDEDFVSSQAQLPPHEKQRSVRGRFKAGKDGLGRYARYDVLVLLRDDVYLYLVDGFYDITSAQFSGERIGNYLLSDVIQHHNDELNARVRLEFRDGWQYEITLLGQREARRVFSPPEAPLINYQQAVARLAVFCPEPPKVDAARLPAPVVYPQLSAGTGQAERPVRALLPGTTLVERFGRFFPAFIRSEANREESSVFKDLLVRVHGDREQAERLIDFERQRRPGHTRIIYLREAIRKLEEDNR